MTRKHTLAWPVFLLLAVVCWGITFALWQIPGFLGSVLSTPSFLVGSIATIGFVVSFFAAILSRGFRVFGVGD
jgi:hypothetical protein